jgi:hypothetical protein
MDGLPDQFLRGIESFNAGEFFECHEVWEEIWQASAGVEREFLHAMIQSAAALLHVRRGNLKGASSVYRRARQKMVSLPQIVMRIDTADFAAQLDSFFDALSETGNRSPAFPKIPL